jgi:hypothetical protein
MALHLRDSHSHAGREIPRRGAPRSLLGRGREAGAIRGRITAPGTTEPPISEAPIDEPSL